jgi:hypothetical protein
MAYIGTLCTVHGVMLAGPASLLLSLACLILGAVTDNTQTQAHKQALVQCLAERVNRRQSN